LDPPQAGNASDPDAGRQFGAIFQRHPGTATGGGSLPTAEAAVLRVMAIPSHGREAWIDPSTAAIMQALLVQPDATPGRPVADVRRALDLTERILDQSFGLVGRDRSWYGSVGLIMASLRRELVGIDRRLSSLQDRNLPAEQRATLSRELHVVVAGLLLGRDLDGDGRVDPRRDVAGLLQLRDTLGYATVTDGEDWNCRALPPSLESVLADYRQEMLWCDTPATAEATPQS
jgi:hypothetical protein